MLYGVSYYHEYQPYERLAEDIRLMQEAGLTVVRLGESTWSSFEPEDARFELDWMDRIIDALHAAGIKVIFGTPTYSIPPWLHRRHPEIMAQYAHGQKAWYGARQNMDFTNPVYRFHAERIIRKLVSHYAPHPAIVGWQIDNETGSGFLHNPGVFASFIDYLRAKFGSAQALNDIWGLTYWSHRLTDWADLWTPDGNSSPGYDLEWRRFQAGLVTEFLAWQAGIVREYARPDQPITQDCPGNHNRDESDLYAIAQITDVTAINPYHATQDGLGVDGQGAIALPPWLAWARAGLWSLNFNGDFGRSGRQANFWVAELNALSIGGSSTNYPAYDGQWRSVVYTYISKGANLLAYWHWHTLHYGNEIYWGGVLNHDLEPNRCYAEISRIAHELRQLDALFTDLKPRANVGFLYSQDSKYALECQPCLMLSGSSDPDRHSYQHIFDCFYQAFYRARADTAIVHPQQNFSSFPVLVVPALYIADDVLLERLAKYAADGGHLLLTFRSGYADQFGRARWQRAPGPLRPAVGTSYQEYSNLAAGLPVEAQAPDFALPPDARAESWADGLQLEGATPLVTYQHPHFGRFPAIVSQVWGKGRVTYCGTLPNRPLGTALAQWVLAQANLTSPLNHLPPAVRVNSATAHSRQRLHFVTNWSWDRREIRLPWRGRQLLRDQPLGPTLTLDAWETEIVVEA